MNRNCFSNCFAFKRCCCGSRKSFNRPSEPTKPSDSIVIPTNDLRHIAKHSQIWNY